MTECLSTSTLRNKERVYSLSIIQSVAYMHSKWVAPSPSVFQGGINCSSNVSMASQPLRLLNRFTPTD